MNWNDVFDLDPGTLLLGVLMSVVRGFVEKVSPGLAFMIGLSLALATMIGRMLMVLAILFGARGCTSNR